MQPVGVKVTIRGRGELLLDYVTLLTPQGTLGGYLHTQHVTLSHVDTTGSVSEHQRKEGSRILVSR